MGITRRQALWLGGAGAVVANAPSWAVAGGPSRATDASLYPSESLSPWPVLQGPTDHRSANLILLLPTDLAFSVSVEDEAGNERQWRTAERRDMPSIGLSTIEIVVGGLTPGRDYTLHLRGETGGYYDRRIFRALDLSGSRCRFAAVSCMNDLFKHHAVTMWEALAREHCDFVVIHGDTCYADQRNPTKDVAGYEQRYSETRMLLSWFKLERLVPTFAVWDDHDFGANNGDRTSTTAAFMQPLFRAFWGSTDNAAWQKGHGAGSRLEAFGQRFYLLDGRSFRDPDDTLDGRHWGDGQLQGLLNDVRENSRPGWVLNGNQFFGANPFREAVESDQPADLRRLTDGLSRSNAPVAFISGDVHFSEIRRVDPQWLGYDSFEFTSSSMHSMPNPGRINTDNIVAERRHNFMVFDVDAAGALSVRCRSILEGNRVAFDESFAIRRH